MNNKELYEILNIPEPVIRKFNEYEQSRTITPDKELISRMLERSTWDEAVKSLQEMLADDTDGIKILWEQLNIVCEVYDKYMEKGIPHKVFVDTMMYVTRFLNEHKAAHNTYKYIWAWWFPREMSMDEFRIGALEYEMVRGEDMEIYMHIPSDADFSMESVRQSIAEFRKFISMYYPEWENAKFVCDSWLLSPALRDLLDNDSNIIQYQNLFDIVYSDYDSPWFMDWVYPGYEGDYGHLPEKTTLQKNMKQYLISGKKVGSAKGYLKE